MKNNLLYFSCTFDFYTFLWKSHISRHWKTDRKYNTFCLFTLKETLNSNKQRSESDKVSFHLPKSLVSVSSFYLMVLDKMLFLIFILKLLLLISHPSHFIIFAQSVPLDRHRYTRWDNVEK